MFVIPFWQPKTVLHSICTGYVYETAEKCKKRVVSTVDPVKRVVVLNHRPNMDAKRPAVVVWMQKGVITTKSSWALSANNVVVER